MLLLAASPLAVGWAAVRPAAEATAIAAIFPPWWSGERAFAAASSVGAVIREGAVPVVLVVRTPAGDGAARLRSAGAWLVLDPKAVEGCLKE